MSLPPICKCGRPMPAHTVEPGWVGIDDNDERDPFTLLDPQPETFTPEERAEAIRCMGELIPDGTVERMEATIRHLLKETDQ